MKTIKVKFAKTDLEQKLNGSLSFVTRYTEKEMTFDEILSHHRENNKGIRVCPPKQYGMLGDDFGQTAKQLPFNKLQEEVEANNVMYEVNLSRPVIYFQPLVKTEEEMREFEEEVQKMGITG
jgi:hypothetical protein